VTYSSLRAFLERGHKATLGKTGAGKSVVMKWLYEWVPHPWVAIYVTPHDDLPPGHRMRHPSEIRQLVAQGVKRIVWPVPKEDDIEGGRDAVMALLRVLVAALIRIGKRRMQGDKAPVSFILFIDEVHHFTSKSGYIGPVERVLSEGRKYGIRAVLGTTRPARVSLEVLGQAQDVLVLKLDPPDSGYLRRAGYPIQEIEEWTDGESCPEHPGGAFHVALMRGKQWEPFEPVPFEEPA
jgi:hypothetical protein